MSKPTAKRLRVDENYLNGICNAMAGILQGMVAAVKRRIAIFNAAGGCCNGKIEKKALRSARHGV